MADFFSRLLNNLVKSCINKVLRLSFSECLIHISKEGKNKGAAWHLKQKYGPAVFASISLQADVELFWHNIYQTYGP